MKNGYKAMLGTLLGSVVKERVRLSTDVVHQSRVLFANFAALFRAQLFKSALL